MKHHSALWELTTRQLTVLQLHACGMCPEDIARALSTSKRNVDGLKAKIMAKLGIHDRVELAVFAIAEGLGIPRPECQCVGEDK